MPDIIVYSVSFAVVAVSISLLITVVADTVKRFKK